MKEPEISVRAEVSESRASMGASDAAMEWVASASTVTSDVAVPRVSERSSDVVWSAVTLTFFVSGAKPGAVTLTVYAPAGRPETV
jgi:hypothetical protein